MPWMQRKLTLPRFRRGFHLITDIVLKELPEIAGIRTGILHLFIQHTSASLTINENADPDVRVDMETAANHLAPEDLDYTHTLEGSDDMPAHVKASVFGVSLSMPITDGGLNLGVWQGIYLCEHRNHAEGRRLVATVWGE